MSQINVIVVRSYEVVVGGYAIVVESYRQSR